MHCKLLALRAGADRHLSVHLALERKGGVRLVKKSEWYAVLQNLMWLMQLGLSLALPPIFCLWGAGWLTRRFGWGGWVYIAAIVLGVGASACTFIKFAQMLNRKNHKK